MTLFSWIEESLIDGRLHEYLYLEGHVIIRSLFRLIYTIILFYLGFIGLKTLSVKWVVDLWKLWYGIVIIAAGIQKFLLIYRHSLLSENNWNFLHSFYNEALTPFPYIFLLFLYFIITKKINRATLFGYLLLRL